MKKLLPLLLASALSAHIVAAPADRVDWPKFMSRHDIVWEKLPEQPRDAAHLGNGALGSMIFAHVKNRVIRLQVFRHDVQDHRDDSWGGTAYSRPRLLIGEFHLTPVGDLVGCQLRQDLWNAELSGTITTTKGTITLRHFVHAEDPAIVTELKPDAGEQGCAWSWHPAPAQTTRAGLALTETERQAHIKRYKKDIRLWEPNPAGRQEERNGVNVWIQDLLVGGQYATAWQERTAPDGTRTSLISIDHTYPAQTAAETAVAAVVSAHSKPVDAWRQAHQRWWHDYYRQSFVSLPDTRLESAYWGTVYRWAASSRAGRGYMDTSGIWFQGGGWPYTTMNFNIQACLWGVYGANRLVVGQSLVEALHRNQQTLIENVPNEEWRSDSAYIGRAVAPDFKSSGWGKPGEPEMGLLTWTLHNAWLQYRYSMDESMLRDTVYPLLRRSVNLYRHLAKEGEDGRIHLPETFSPERGAFPDCNFDLSLFRWGLETLLWSSARLKIDDPLIPVWKDLLTRLVPFPTDNQGFRFGATRTFDGSHRHASHLLMVYPLGIISTDQPEWCDHIRASAQSYGACDSPLLAMAGLQAAPIAAVAGFPELAHLRIQLHSDDLSPAGFGDSSGWCMEGAVGIANSIQMLMIQSHGDRIRVFPAMPKAWPDAVFRDLRAEGAFLVSARREGDRTRWVQITSLAGEPCRVEPNLKGKVRVIGGKSGVKLTERGNGIYDISLAKGESVTLAGEEDPGTPLIDALPEQPGLTNTFGLHGTAESFSGARVEEGFEMLKNPDPLLQWAGVMIIAKRGTAEDAGALIDAAPHLQAKAKKSLREALGVMLRNFGGRIRPALYAAMENPATRNLVIGVFADTGNLQDLTAVAALAKTGDSATRRFVLDTLSSRRIPEITPILLDLHTAATADAQRKEILLAVINAARGQENVTLRAQILEPALPFITDEAMKKQAEGLLPTRQ